MSETGFWLECSSPSTASIRTGKSVIALLKTPLDLKNSVSNIIYMTYIYMHLIKILTLGVALPTFECKHKVHILTGDTKLNSVIQ